MLACVPSPVKDASEQNADLLTCVGEKSSLDEVLAFALSKINLEDGGNISGDCVQVLLYCLVLDFNFPLNQEFKTGTCVILYQSTLLQYILKLRIST